MTFEEQIHRISVYFELQTEALRFILQAVVALNAMGSNDSEETKKDPTDGLLEKFERILAVSDMLVHVVEKNRKILCIS